MRVKIFRTSGVYPRSLEEQVQAFFSENPEITIVSVVQSESALAGETMITLTIIYQP